MNNLRQFLFKLVTIELTDGTTHSGYVDDYESALDNEDPEMGIPKEESIGVYPFKGSRNGIEFYEHEIKSIQVDE